MKTVRSYPTLTRRFYRPQQYVCPECQRHLQRAVTLSERTVITFTEVIKLIHAGYRCPNQECPAHGRTYRSAAADALALPGFTFGIDIVLWVGYLHLSLHRTVDEVHRDLLERLAPLGVSICRREVLYLFDAYCSLLRAASDVKEDRQWVEQAKKNGGIILSIDGIQPDKGNETVYIVRDALTGRVLAAENVTSSETEVMKQLLAPVKALLKTLEVPVLGTISDAQETLLKALEELWPGVPHQSCQFHALREASRPAYEIDRALKTQMRQELQPKLNAVRQQIARHAKRASAREAKQLAALDDYASGLITALNFEGRLPFDYPAVAAAAAMDEVASSLQRLEKRGRH
jgi:hypothetical protein